MKGHTYICTYVIVSYSIQKHNLQLVKTMVPVLRKDTLNMPHASVSSDRLAHRQNITSYRDDDEEEEDDDGNNHAYRTEIGLNYLRCVFAI